MHVFKTTFPGTQAQADQIEQALILAEQNGSNILSGDVRISHDQARMEITIEPGGDQDDMDWDLRDLEMGVETVALAVHDMLKNANAEITVSFPYLNIRNLTGGVVVVNKGSVTVQPAEGAIQDIERRGIPF